jgi:hypothetical protein
VYLAELILVPVVAPVTGVFDGMDFRPAVANATKQSRRGLGIASCRNVDATVFH